MIKQHGGKLILLGIAVLLAGAFWYANQAAEKANEGIVVAANIKGNPEAAVTLVEYSDFQCPACAQASGVVAEIIDTYGDQISFEYRHFPLVQIHPQAVPAARAAEAAAQQGKFWEMHDLLFANQQRWSEAPNPTALFVGYAEELELDTGLFRRHLGASRLQDHVQEQFSEARESGFSGTPTFVLNGERMEFETYADFIAQIEAAIGVDPAATSTDTVVDEDDA